VPRGAAAASGCLIGLPDPLSSGSGSFLPRVVALAALAFHFDPNDAYGDIFATDQKRGIFFDFYSPKKSNATRMDSQNESDGL